MAMTTTFKPNMGTADRLVRGALGGLLLVNGITHFKHSAPRRWETLIGGAFLIYGLTGFDPLLKLFGASTIPKAKNNILNLLKQTAPGQGINPILTQQALPKRPTLGIDPDIPVSEAFSIR
jgi:hypothetical protein